MTRGALKFAIAGLTLSQSLFAQAVFAQGGSLDDQQKLGERLFAQSCVVCHTKPQITSPQYGPVLSQITLGGKADVMRDVISGGTPRMPAFKTQFQPAQIDAIVAYLKTVPAPSTAPARPAGKAGDANDD